YQDLKYAEKIHQRYTDGGRLEFEKDKFYVTASAYYQSGKNSTGKNINAFYIQPEIKYTVPENLTLRLGVEIFSGDNGKVKSASDHNFIALYGVAHRFNGSMDYFTTFPADFNNAGLVNPYLFAIKDIGKKIQMRADFHLFYTQNHFVQNKETISRYLGYENDWLLTYKPNSYAKIDLGVSYLIPTKSLEIIKKGSDSAYIPTWAYLSITFKPQLLKTIFK
ncbi:MAG: hypothetical protein H0W84_05170, partial [Bacteroidetes bacterium]|nr:hypothetical protein [Bacteroidota bacterium]